MSDTPEKIGVFISYNHADITMANALKQALTAISSDLEPFIDHAKLKPGDEYEEKLAISIDASRWFLMLCSGPPRLEKDMGWCLYEAGQFRRKLLREGSEHLIESRFVAIHDDERPTQLAKFQSIKIADKDIYDHTLDLKPARAEEEASILFESTSAFTLFESIIKDSREKPLRDLTDLNVRSLLRAHARELIRAFVNQQTTTFKLPEIVFQPRISFRLAPPSDAIALKLYPQITVTGYQTSLEQIFGIIAPETTWGKIKNLCRDENDNEAHWVSEIEAAAEQVSLELKPKQPEGLCLAKGDGKFYEVLFARCEPFKSGARICHIVFVPRRSRHFDVNEQTSLFLSALILAIRFRQRILTFIKRFRDLPRKNKFGGVLGLEKELLEIETEAQEFGLPLPEFDGPEPPLARQFREGPNRLFVGQSIKSWETSRQVLAAVFKSVRSPDADQVQAAVEGGDAIVKELEKFQEVNCKFIQVLTEELLYSESVGSGEGNRLPALTV